MKKGWDITAAMAFDRGTQTGNNFGVQLTVAKSGILPKLRIKKKNHLKIKKTS